MSWRKVFAAVARSKSEKLAVENLFLAPPRAHEVVVRLVSTGICHTDAHVKNHGFCHFPSVLGHEGTGVVEELGSSVQGSGLKVGDNVVMSYAACGSCRFCRKAKPSYCVSHGDLNFSGARGDGSRTLKSVDGEEVAGSFFQQSSFASHALTTLSNLVKVDKSVPLAKLAPLGCAAQTGAGAILNTFGVSAGSNVLVTGCGAVGLSAIMAAARIAAAQRVVAVDVNEGRLALARKLGATHTVHLTKQRTQEDLLQEIMDSTANMGVDYALDTSGVTNAMITASKCLAPMGTLGMVAPGVPGQKVELECLTMLAGKQFRGIVQGDAVAQEFIPQLIGHWQAGRFPFEEMLTEYESLHHINQALADMHAGTTLKPIIHISPP